VRDGRVAGAAQKLGTDTWKLDACPMDGGGIAVDHGQILTAWRRGTDIYLAHPGEKETHIGAGMDVALGGAVAIWNHGGSIETKSGVLGAGTFPSVVALPDGDVLAAWEDRGTIQVRRLPGK